MTKDNNLKPLVANKKPFETVQEIENKYEIPSWEEFEKNYQGENVNYDDLNSSNIGTKKGYGPCSWDNPDCTCYQSELQRRYSVAVINNEYNVQNTIINIWVIRWPETRPITPPSITEVKFETRGSTKPGNYRTVGTLFGGVVGNIIGGLIKDEDRHKASGELFTSYKSSPLTFWSFYETSTLSEIDGNRTDYHHDKIICKSKNNLNELKGKIGNIVEVWDWSSGKNRTDKEYYFKNKVESLLDRNEQGEDINGHYWI